MEGHSKIKTQFFLVQCIGPCTLIEKCFPGHPATDMDEGQRCIHQDLKKNQRPIDFCQKHENELHLGHDIANLKK